MAPEPATSLTSFPRRPERRDEPAGRMMGRLVSLNGMHALMATRVGGQEADNSWSIGHLITIDHRSTRIIGVVCEINAAGHVWSEADANVAHVKIELTGEIIDDLLGRPQFHRGIRSYPELGAVGHRIRTSDLAAIYAFQGREGIEIGKLSQNESIPAVISVNELITRHFAVVGSTGVGKTTAVSMLLHKCLGERPNLRALIVDPHNEYAKHFAGKSLVLDSENLEIPFWMFRFEELLDIVYAGRHPGEEELDAFFDVIKTAKTRFASAPPSLLTPAALRKPSGTEPSSISADTPVPYRISDALKIIDEWQGLLDKRYKVADLRTLKIRLETLAKDPRFKFMFGRTMVEDNMARVIARIFRIPAEDCPVAILQLAGLPNEVVNSVVSVLARLAFDIALWSRGGYEIALICEEAHRYIPSDRTLGFGPTRQAIGRIAKEGRKYGVSLGVISQRPSELDPTILSQCSTMFAMRLPNEADKAIIRSALAESSASIVSFLSSIADREAIAFGEAIPTPMRMKFADTERPLETHEDSIRKPAPIGALGIASVVARLRGEGAMEPT